MSREAAKNAKGNTFQKERMVQTVYYRMPSIEEISAIVVDAGLQIHRDWGPGLLESVYESVLTRYLQDRGLTVSRQEVVPIDYGGVRLDEGFRADLVVEKSLVLELKSVERLAPVHYKQLLTYLRLMRLPLGLLLNFGAATFREGVKRVVNNHQDLTASRLRMNQKPISSLVRPDSPSAPPERLS